MTPVIGTVGAVLFVVTFLLDGATRPGYRPTHQTVSALALGPRGWVQTTNFVVSGAAITASAVGIHAAAGGPWLAGAVAVFGIALVASGVFAMDPMRSYPPGTPPGDPTTTSRAHERHDTAGAVVFGSLPVCAVVAAVTVDGTVWTIASVVVAVHLAVTASRFATAWEADDPRTGVVQRAYLVPGLLWLGALCWHLAA
ncbi:DUF998 domain-containing protein [Nitriliruptoraceae bacterium ZYF776]|nr:DUF998 domain-containing protein [Profundirhabdus halotolerans]